VSAEDQRTRTKEVVEAQTVEEEEYYCPNCEQWFDEEELVSVGVAVDEDGDDPEEVDQLCATCAEIVFDYNGATGDLDAVREEVRRLTWQEMVAGAFSASLVVGVGAAAVHMLGTGFKRAIEGLNELGPISDPATPATAAGDMLSVMFELIPLVLGISLAIAVANVIRWGRI